MSAAWTVSRFGTGPAQGRYTALRQGSKTGVEMQYARAGEFELAASKLSMGKTTFAERSRSLPGGVTESHVSISVSFQTRTEFRGTTKSLSSANHVAPSRLPLLAHLPLQRQPSEFATSSRPLPLHRVATCAIHGADSVPPNGFNQSNGAILPQGGDLPSSPSLPSPSSPSSTVKPLPSEDENGTVRFHIKPSGEDRVEFEHGIPSGSEFRGTGHGSPEPSAQERETPILAELDGKASTPNLFPEVPEPLDGVSKAEEKDGWGFEGFKRMVVDEFPVKKGEESGPNDSLQSEHKMLAAVDMGTNSFHMVVVRADSQGRFQIEDVEKEDVRLGSGSAGFSVITPEAEERALAAIKRLKKIAHNRRATMRVVATSAVREARNRRAFIRRMHEVTGVEVEVLTGREEACLIYMGILQALPVFSKTVLTVDIGGGSTEFVLGRAGKPLFATSLKLGHIRLTERFAGSEPLTRAQVEEMRRFIRVALADSGVLEVVHNAEFEVAIGSSGTIETVEQMIHHSNGGTAAGPGAEGSGTPKRLPGFQEKEFDREELAAMVKKICKAKTVETRAKIPGLPEKRADVIVGGAVLLEEIFSAMGIQKMQVSPYALREGVIVDTLASTFQAYCPTPNLRRSSVLNLAKKFNVDRRMESALHSAELALEILSGLQSCRTGGRDCMTEAVQQLEESDAEVLEAATILHYVGMFISHKGYHKHSHYLIKNNEHLLGFTPMEVEMIALLARYHRKKVPSPKDEEFAKLPEEVQKRFRALCAVIRIAVALDRCDSGSVASVHALQDHTSIVLAVFPAVDTASGTIKDVSLEVWAARGELEYFEKVFKRKASIVVADQPDLESLKAEASPTLSS